jgi:alkylation response protein AidB-like acyl-CoA dehydrogenase
MTELISAAHVAHVLDRVLHVETLTQLPRFAEHDRTTFEGTLETARRLAVDHFAPSHRALDDAEPRLEQGRVVLPAAIGEALAALRQTGFLAAVQDHAHGGWQLPRTIANAAFLELQAANVSIANYAFLTMSAAELLARHGTAEQQARWMRPMLEGRFLGTMALSEPQAGSSLGDIATTARRLPDGRYALVGNKMWISGGEHDLGENIVHLMLARIEGAPAGTRGISLFIVPRKRLDADGRAGIWNNITLAGLNHKMGQRGTVNTVLSVGDGGECIGEIVDGPGRGLACMFTMMNEARLAVSMGAVAHASAGYRLSLAYARERLQGRHPDAKDPASPPVALIEHADVRRMLLQQKVTAEGGIAFGLYLAHLADVKQAGESEAGRADAALLLDLLTPVFKAWMSEEALSANSNAMQVLGGAGYTRDHGLELHWRDNRLNPIHEGTNGIQAIDLVGRKLALAGGRAAALLVARMRETVVAAGRHAAFVGEAEALATAVAELEAVIAHLAEIGRRDGARAMLAHANAAMELVGATTLSWVWLWQATAGRPASGPDGDDFRAGLTAACRWCFRHVLPRARLAAETIRAGEDVALATRPEWL